MKKLRALRIGSNYTQAALADMLHVSQQTIARWETGKAEPNIAALRDIAVLFGTSVDELLELEKNKKAKITTNHYHLFGGETSDGFWGHIGLLLPGHQKTKWYPITLMEAERLSGQITPKLYGQDTENTDWLVVSTLNNRMLVFAFSTLKHIQLLNDDLDQPPNDWDLSWDSYQGHSPEIYRALEDYFYPVSDEDYKEQYSETLRNIVEELINEHELDEEKLDEWIIDTHIHFVDGTSTHYFVDHEHLCSAVESAEMGESFGAFELDHMNGTKLYYPSKAVCLIDMPLLRYYQGCKDVYEELEDDDKSRESIHGH